MEYALAYWFFSGYQYIIASIRPGFYQNSPPDKFANWSMRHELVHLLNEWHRACERVWFPPLCVNQQMCISHSLPTRNDWPNSYALVGYRYKFLCCDVNVLGAGSLPIATTHVVTPVYSFDEDVTVPVLSCTLCIACRIPPTAIMWAFSLWTVVLVQIVCMYSGQHFSDTIFLSNVVMFAGPIFVVWNSWNIRYYIYIKVLSHL